MTQHYGSRKITTDINGISSRNIKYRNVNNGDPIFDLSHKLNFPAGEKSAANTSFDLFRSGTGWGMAVHANTNTIAVGSARTWVTQTYDTDSTVIQTTAPESHQNTGMFHVFDLDTGNLRYKAIKPFFPNATSVAPTEGNPQFASLGGGYEYSNISNIAVTDQFDTLVTTEQDILIRDNGEDIFILEYGGSLKHFRLATAWDITSTPTSIVSISLPQQSFINSNANEFRSFTIDPSGTKVLVRYEVSGVVNVHQFNLGTAWSLGSTLTDVGTFTNFPTDMSDSRGVRWAKNGEIICFGGNNLKERFGQATCSTAYDITTIGTISSWTISQLYGSDLDPNQTGSYWPWGSQYSDDGTKLFVSSVYGYDPVQFPLNDPYNPNNAVASSGPVLSNTTNDNFSSAHFADGGKYQISVRNTPNGDIGLFSTGSDPIGQDNYSDYFGEIITVNIHGIYVGHQEFSSADKFSEEGRVYKYPLTGSDNPVPVVIDERLGWTDTNQGKFADEFGESLASTDDKVYIATGETNWNGTQYAAGAGSVRIYPGNYTPSLVNNIIDVWNPDYNMSGSYSNPSGLGDNFGRGVQVSGDLLAVGVKIYGGVNSSYNSQGMVSLRDSATGQERYRLYSPANHNNQLFGAKGGTITGSTDTVGPIGLDRNSNYLAVGAVSSDGTGVSDKGIVYVYSLPAGTISNSNSPTLIWTINNPVYDSGTVTGFGKAVQIRGDYLFISGKYDSNAPHPGVFIYKISTQQFVQRVTKPSSIDAPSPANWGSFFQVSEDGEWLAIPTYSFQTTGYGADVDNVYIFRNTSN